MSFAWQTARLDSIFEIARGGSPRPIDNFITDDADGLNWVKISDATASGKYIERTKEKIRPAGLSKTRQVFPGDFLLTNSMSFGRPYIMATEGCIHDGWLLLRPRDERIVWREFFYHLLGSQAVYDRLASRAAGSTVKNLNTDIVASVEIPLPPLDEQKRIAAILDKADQLRQKRRQAIALLDSLTQSIFLEMFGDPVSNPKGLLKTPLGDLIKVSSGNGLTSAQMDTAGMYSVYGGNGINGSHSAYMFEDPQIAIGRVGVYCGAVHVTKPNSWITDNALYVSENFAGLRLRYLAEALRMADLNQYAGRAAQPLISGSRIYPVEILVPNVDEQLLFEKLLFAVETNHRRIYTSQHQIDTMFLSLQHRAFSGQL